MGILAALAAFFKSIPALAEIGKLIDKWAEQWKAVDVQKRKAEKDAAVDSSIDAALHPADGLSASETGKQSKADGQTGLSGSSPSGA